MIILAMSEQKTLSIKYYKNSIINFKGRGQNSFELRSLFCLQIQMRIYDVNPMFYIETTLTKWYNKLVKQ